MIGNAVVDNLQPSPSAPAGNTSNVDTADGGSTGTTTDALTRNVNSLLSPVQLEDIQVDPSLVPLAPISVTAQSGDSISTLVGTSDPVAIEAFQRANGMSGTDSTIYAGQPYNLPGTADYAAAEADGGQQGQATLDTDNERQLAELQPVSVSADYLASASAVPAGSSAPTGGFLAENQASADAYWSSVQDNAVSQGSFLEYAGAGIMQKLADVGYGVAQTAVAMYEQPGSALEGAGKAVVNFGPSAFNAATDLAKESANGLTLLAEQSPFVPRGEFAGFRSSEPYTIPLLVPYSDQAEMGGAVLANIGLGAAGSALGELSLQSPIVPVGAGEMGVFGIKALQSPLVAPLTLDQRAQALLSGAPGVNITAMNDALNYRFNIAGGIAGSGTAVTDAQAFEDVIGPLPRGNQMTITSNQAAALENALGLPTGRLSNGGIISVVNDIAGRMPRSPLSGNAFFLRGGSGLPGGGPEFNIAPINTAGGGGIRQIVVYVGAP